MRLFRFGLLILLIFLSQNTNSAAQTDLGNIQILRTDQIYPGMNGYVLTPLDNDELVKVQIEILSVTGNKSDAFPFHSGIMIKVLHESTPENWVGFSPDMAGSPVYVNDRLIGGLCRFYTWSRHEFAQVRPIEEILRLSEFHQKDDGLEEKNKPRTVFDTDQMSNALIDSSSGNASFSFVSDETPMVIIPEALKSGDSVAAVWSIGDYTSYQKGNLTLVDGDSFYAFGNSVFGRCGAINAPLVRTEVLSQMYGYEDCIQIVNPGMIVGTISQDRSAGIYGKLGIVPDMIPVETIIHDVPYGKVYNALSMVLRDERFYPNLIPDAVAHSMRKKLDVSWEGTIDVTFRITYSINNGGPKEFQVRNMYFSDQVINNAVDDMRSVLQVLAQNDFTQVSIEKVQVDVFWTPYREIARIESVSLMDASERKKEDDRFVIQHGEEITVLVNVRHFKSGPVEQKVIFKIDNSFPVGKAVIQVRGDGSIAPPARFISDENRKRIEDLISNRVRLSDPVPPQGLEQLLANLSCNMLNNRRIVEIITTEKKPKKGEEKFSQSDSLDMDEIIYGFESIPITIKDNKQ